MVDYLLTSLPGPFARFLVVNGNLSGIVSGPSIINKTISDGVITIDESSDDANEYIITVHSEGV